MQHDPDLTDQNAQVLLTTQNSADFDDTQLPFSSLVKAIIESNASTDQVLNMDETVFYKAGNALLLCVDQRTCGRLGLLQSST